MIFRHVRHVRHDRHVRHVRHVRLEVLLASIDTLFVNY